MATIPSSYEESRDRFRASIHAVRAAWQDAQITSIPLTGQPELTIEVISAEAKHAKQNRLILTTGLHGIEGYVGSGILQLFIVEYLPRMNPDITGILLVHPINPYGMKNRTRVNRNNVDLNRNFNPGFNSMETINPHYESLRYLLNPGRALKSPFHEKAMFLVNVLRAISKGAGFIRETALMGQYRIQEGMYFGGLELQEEAKIMMDLLTTTINGYAQVVVFDIHSGYGPRKQMTLVIPPSEKRSTNEIKKRYDLPNVVGTNLDEFYSIHGDMTDYILRYLAGGMQADGCQAYTFEFGTYGDSFLNTVHSLRTTVLENCLRLFGGSDASRDWMEKEYQELFIPTESRWWDKAQQDARLHFERILGAEGFLN